MEKALRFLGALATKIQSLIEVGPVAVGQHRVAALELAAELQRENKSEFIFGLSMA